MATTNTINSRTNGTATMVTNKGVERVLPVPGGVGLTTDGEGCSTSAWNIIMKNYYFTYFLTLSVFLALLQYLPTTNVNSL